jgi:hypothetical protein
MIKVQQLIQNQCFLQEAGDYLEANGYSRKAGELVTGCLYFFNGTKAVMVYGDNVDFLIHDDGEPDQRSVGYRRYMAVTSISDLDLFKWMLLFHIADVVPLKQFMKEAKREVPADVTGFMVQIFDHFRITENHNAVPLGY